MDPQMWQQLQGQFSTVAPALPIGEVPMKGVILANRKTIFHKTRVCPRLSMGACHLGSKCNFAHSVEELRPAPNLDKTKLCPSVLYPGTLCPAKVRGEICRFAHNKAEIRHTSNMFKTNMCLKWIRGKCKKDLQCNHAHGHQELKYYRSLAMASGSRDFARESEATMSRRRKQNTIAAVTAPSLSGLADILYASRRQQQSQWTDSISSENSSCQETLLRLLACTSSAARQPQGNNGCGSVSGALAALYEELLKYKNAEDKQGAIGTLGASQDDSTNATDECSDFSSFSSRALSDALRSAASSGGSYGGSLHPAVLQPARSPLVTNNSNTSYSSSTKISDMSLDVDRLLLLKMLADKDGKHSTDANNSEEQQMLPLSEMVTACASPTTSILTGRDTTTPGMDALESSLARFCLTDPALKRHCYAEPPPGFEGRSWQQHQQHAMVDLDRLTSSAAVD